MHTVKRSRELECGFQIESCMCLQSLPMKTQDSIYIHGNIKRSQPAGLQTPVKLGRLVALYRGGQTPWLLMDVHTVKMEVCMAHYWCAYRDK